MNTSQLPQAHPGCVITPDTLELLHLRHSFPPCTARRQTSRNVGIRVRRWGQLRPALRPQVGPDQAGIPTASAKAGFTGRMIVSTTDKWSKHAEAGDGDGLAFE